MVEIDVDVLLGGATAVTVLDTTTGQRISSGKCALAGWSLRTTSSQASQQTQGQFAAPPANTTISSILLGQGEWILQWDIAFGGTPAANEANNLAIFQGATLLVGSENGFAVGTEYPQAQITVSLPAGGATIAIKNTLAGTAGSTYFASITATPVAAVAIAEITSGSNPVAEIALGVGQVDTRWFGSGGIEMSSDVTLAVIGGTMRGAVYVRLELPYTPG